MVEQLPLKQLVVGSSPTGRTKIAKPFFAFVGLEPEAHVSNERSDYDDVAF